MPHSQPPNARAVHICNQEAIIILKAPPTVFKFKLAPPYQETIKVKKSLSIPPAPRSAPNHRTVPRLPHRHSWDPKGLAAAGAKLGDGTTNTSAWDSRHQDRKIMTLLEARALGAKGIATRSKDATRGSWHRY